jgi:hypothetical protein
MDMGLRETFRLTCLLQVRFCVAVLTVLVFARQSNQAVKQGAEERMSQSLAVALPESSASLPSFISPTDYVMELEQGVLIYRASPSVQQRLEMLLEKQRDKSLTEAETEELDRYEEIDYELSYQNRLLRNQELAAVGKL